MEQKLTIGMAHHNDFSGAYFTIQDIRKELLFNNRQDLLNKIEFIVVENDKDSEHAKSLKNVAAQGNVRVINFDTTFGTSATRNKIIEEARGHFVLVMDCHVLLCPVVETLDRLFTYMSYNNDTNDLFCGPLVYDTMNMCSTHFNDSWGGQMWGQWGISWQCVCEAFNFSITNKDGKCKYVSLAQQEELSKCPYCDRDFPSLEYSGHEVHLNKEGYETIGQNPYNKPFEVFAQGLGLFFTRKNAWLGFNEHARGFGGEECYIHEKYRKAGRKTICLPFLRWLHRFGRPDGVKYQLTLDNKVRNYILEFVEIGLDMAPLSQHFVDENNFPVSRWEEIVKEAQTIYNKPSSHDESADLANQIKKLQEKLSKLENKKCCRSGK